MEPVRVAIIGSTGAIGQTHIDAIDNLSSCRLVGVSGRRQPPLLQQAAQLSVTPYPSLDDVLGDSDVDAVIIATPHPSHKDITLRAISSGKHVLVEKPISVTPAESDEMVKAARKAKLTLGVLYNNRFRAEALKMHDLIKGGEIGNIYRGNMISAMFRSQDYYDRLDWRGTWKYEGGGTLINQGIHAIDMFLWLMGMPETVTGVLRTLKHRIEVEDYASSILEYENGALASIQCDTVQAPNKQRIEIYGENGAIIMDDWKVTLHRMKTPVQEFLETDRTVKFVPPDSTSETFDFGPEKGTHAPAIDDFCRAIREGRDPLVTGEEGARAQELVAAITLSGCTGKKVELPVDRSEYDQLMESLQLAGRLPDICDVS
ncbi:MAG: Gfo/Idh/MocA family oxidoreductase [SAR202 cluster bacterium]|mgnify:FL=1|jgi:UDP-N-acetyl-2-amino-2-deoxyglucuronate dehydrogenase|nr:Gfo/Idh/MocA family oxidoreductase [SAR202 cluster bacterium]MQG65865.1 Gfo/Idh/MocA family oxidoreductase [SAR202 cluster bacterium]|tara:strand:- start:38625 stop:39746 length:1122 start_codon:yes stop_codon:yes gene_type:complete